MAKRIRAGIAHALLTDITDADAVMCTDGFMNDGRWQVSPCMCEHRVLKSGRPLVLTLRSQDFGIGVGRWEMTQQCCKAHDIIRSTATTRFRQDNDKDDTGAEKIREYRCEAQAYLEHSHE